MLTTAPSEPRTAGALLALLLVLLSLAAFFYSLHLRRQDWVATAPHRLTMLVPAGTLRL
ncbi:MAG: hypothetical protein ACRD0Y_01580 [Terriglobales bacterium]